MIYEQEQNRKDEGGLLKIFLIAVAAGIAFTAGLARGSTPQEKENEKAVLEFYERAINQKDFAAAAKYLGPRYIQHNQTAADGGEGLENFIKFLKEKYPASHSEIKRVFADGDYVILHVHAVRSPGSRGMAVVDIFRLQDGKIAEHWDVHEDLAEKPANANGMF